MGVNYKVLIVRSAQQDIKEKKKYIIDTFKYRELGKNFSKKMKKAAIELEILPQGHCRTEFAYRGYDIYMKPSNTYLLFYAIDEIGQVVTVLRVLQDGMDWKYIIKRWIRENQ